MYLSKLDVKAQASPKELAQFIRQDGYRLHQWVWSLFPKNPDKDRDFLFRINDPAAEGGLPSLYLLSPEPPLDSHSLFEVRTKPFEPQLATGLELAFSLRANATVTKKKDDHSKKRERHDVLMEAKHRWKEEHKDKPFPRAEMEQITGLNWLESRGAQNGFELNRSASRVTGYRRQMFLGKTKDPKKATHVTLFDFEGRLRVTDPKAFEACLRTGLGRAKGFGCGLMLIRRG